LNCMWQYENVLQVGNAMSFCDESVLCYSDTVIEKGKFIKQPKNKENIASMVSHTSHRTVITITITQYVILI
jgi:hypothetical protein